MARDITFKTYSILWATKDQIADKLEDYEKSQGLAFPEEEKRQKTFEGKWDVPHHIKKEIPHVIDVGEKDNLPQDLLNFDPEEDLATWEVFLDKDEALEKAEELSQDSEEYFLVFEDTEKYHLNDAQEAEYDRDLHSSSEFESLLKQFFREDQEAENDQYIESYTENINPWEDNNQIRANWKQSQYKIIFDILKAYTVDFDSYNLENSQSSDLPDIDYYRENIDTEDQFEKDMILKMKPYYRWLFIKEYNLLERNDNLPKYPTIGRSGEIVFYLNLDVKEIIAALSDTDIPFAMLAYVKILLEKETTNEAALDVLKITRREKKEFEERYTYGTLESSARRSHTRADTLVKIDLNAKITQSIIEEARIDKLKTQKQFTFDDDDEEEEEFTYPTELKQEIAESIGALGKSLGDFYKKKLRERGGKKIPGTDQIYEWFHDEGNHLEIELPQEQLVLNLLNLNDRQAIMASIVAEEAILEDKKLSETQKNKLLDERYKIAEERFKLLELADIYEDEDTKKQKEIWGNLIKNFADLAEQYQKDQDAFWYTIMNDRPGEPGWYIRTDREAYGPFKEKADASVLLASLTKGRVFRAFTKTDLDPYVVKHPYSLSADYPMDYTISFVKTYITSKIAEQAAINTMVDLDLTAERFKQLELEDVKIGEKEKVYITGWKTAGRGEWKPVPIDQYLNSDYYLRLSNGQEIEWDVNKIDAIELGDKIGRLLGSNQSWIARHIYQLIWNEIETLDEYQNLPSNGMRSKTSIDLLFTKAFEKSINNDKDFIPDLFHVPEDITSKRFSLLEIEDDDHIKWMREEVESAWEIFERDFLIKWQNTGPQWRDLDDLKQEIIAVGGKATSLSDRNIQQTLLNLKEAINELYISDLQPILDWLGNYNTQHLLD